MLSFLRKTTLVALAAAPALLLSPTTAHAATAAAATTGSGTISPGLTTTPTFQTKVTFTATIAVGAGVDNSGNPMVIVATNCTFTGASSIAETLGEGKGSGTIGGCQGASVTGNINYERTENVVTITGTMTVNGNNGTVTAGVFVFVPTTAPPVTAFQLVGAFAMQ